MSMSSVERSAGGPEHPGVGIHHTAAAGSTGQLGRRVLAGRSGSAWRRGCHRGASL